MTLGNTDLLKETASKFAQTLLQKETLSLLSWMANKSALCLREKLYLYLFKLFAIQTYLRRYSRIEAAKISAQKMCRKARDLKGTVSCYYPHKITAQLYCNHLFTNLYLGFRNERSMLFHTLVTFPLLKTQYKMFAHYFFFNWKFVIKALKYIENDLCLKLLFYLSKNLIIKKKEILVSTVSTI